MVSFPPVSPQRPYTPPSPHPYAPHAQPISFFLILSPFPLFRFTVSNIEYFHISSLVSLLVRYYWVVLYDPRVGKTHGTNRTEEECIKALVRNSEGRGQMWRSRYIRQHTSKMYELLPKIFRIRNDARKPLVLNLWATRYRELYPFVNNSAKRRSAVRRCLFFFLCIFVTSCWYRFVIVPICKNDWCEGETDLNQILLQTRQNDFVNAQNA